jgi:PAS domain S-box-containing protein
VKRGERRPGRRAAAPRTQTARTRSDPAQLQEVIDSAAREWQLTFDAIESPLLILNTDGTIRRLNRAAQRLSGKAHYRDLLERRVEAIGPGEPWAKAAEVAWIIRTQKTPRSLQARDETADRIWEVSGSLIEDRPGAGERIIVVARDISHMVRLQASLRRSEMMSALGSLVAGVAHEVRNPLFSISATLDAFEARFGREQEYARYVAVLRSELERLSVLMGELLEYGRPAAPDLRPGSIEEVITQAMKSCLHVARQYRVRLLSTVDPGIEPLVMDERRLHEVFENLIENAIQHSPAESMVSVSAAVVSERGRRAVECAVEDQGPGIKEGDIHLIFEPFFTRRRGGTGLGLSIVQRIVEQHGGTVRAANRPDGGARMVVRLPLDAPPDQNQAEER